MFIGYAKNFDKYLLVPHKSITFAVANKKYRGVEQLVARQAHNLEVTRSSRVSATKNLGVSSDTPFFVIYSFSMF